MDLSGAEEMARVHGSAVTCLKLEAVEGRYLLSGGGDAKIAVYDVCPDGSPGTGKKLHKPIASVEKGPRGHKYSISSLEWYPYDTGLFVSGSMDETIKVWDTNAMTAVVKFKMVGKVYGVSMSPIATTHKLVAGASANDRVRLCDLTSGGFTHQLTGHTDGILCVQWAPDNQFVLATGSRDQSVRVWDIRQSSRCLACFNQHESKLYLPETGPPTRVAQKAPDAHDGLVNGLCYTPDGQHLLTCGTDDRLRMWDTSNQRNTLVNFPGTRNNFAAKGGQLAVTPASSLVLFPTGTNLNVYDLHTGALVNTLRGHYDTVTSVVAHPWWQTAYSGSADCAVLVWSTTLPTTKEAEQEQGPAVEEATADVDAWSDDGEFT